MRSTLTSGWSKPVSRLAADARLEDLRQRAPERLAAEGGRQARPLLVVEPGLGGGAVVVLERAAALLGAHELDAIELAQDPHVVGNVAERVAELARELVRAADAASLSRWRIRWRRGWESALASRSSSCLREPCIGEGRHVAMKPRRAGSLLH